MVSGCWLLVGEISRKEDAKNLLVALFASKLLKSPVVCIENANLSANHSISGSQKWRKPEMFALLSN